MPVSDEKYEFSDKELLLEYSTLEDPVPSLPDLEALSRFLAPTRKAVVLLQRAGKTVLGHGGLVISDRHIFHGVGVGAPLADLALRE